MNLGGRSVFWSGLIPRMREWELAFWPQPVREHLSGGGYADAETLLTRRNAALVHEFLAGEGLGRDSIDVIGFHGQTVLHRPERRLTVQLGDGAALAAETGIAVVYDLRAADVAARYPYSDKPSPTCVQKCVP